MKVTWFYSSPNKTKLKLKEHIVKQKIKTYLHNTNVNLLAFAPLIKISEHTFYNQKTHCTERLAKTADNFFNTPAYIWDDKANMYIRYLGNGIKEMTMNDCSLLEKPFFWIGKHIQEGLPILTFFSDNELNPVTLGQSFLLFSGFIITACVLSNSNIRERIRSYFSSHNSFDTEILEHDGDKTLAKLVLIGGVSVMILIMSM